MEYESIRVNSLTKKVEQTEGRVDTFEVLTQLRNTSLFNLMLASAQAHTNTVFLV